MKLKLIPHSQASNLVFQSTESFERIIMHVGIVRFLLTIQCVRIFQTRKFQEVLALELKLSKTNWLIAGTYKLSSLGDITLSEIKNILTFHPFNSCHENILLMEDGFNMILSNPNFNELFENHERSASISVPRYFKSID